VVEGAWTLGVADGDLAADAATMLSITQSDAVGNKSDAVALKLTTDVTIAVPTIDAVSTDNLLNKSENDAGFNLTGTGEVGATVTVSGFESGVANKTATVDSNGDWTIAIVDADLADNGTNTLSATQADVAGNVSSATTLALTTDLVAPTAPTITAVSTDDLLNNTENSNGFDLTGTGEVGATVTVSGFESGVANKTATVDSNGDWTIAIVDADLADNGSNSYRRRKPMWRAMSAVRRRVL